MTTSVNFHILPSRLELRLPSASIKILLFIFVCFFVFTHYLPLLYSGKFNFPPEGGDEPSYDSIGYNLAIGRGYGHDASDPVWRKPYIDHNQNGQFSGILSNQASFYQIARRPPFYPLVVATTYKLFGRNFGICRLLNIFFCAVGIALTCCALYHFFGLLPTIFAAVLALHDPVISFWSAKLYTESLTLLLVAGLQLLLFKQTFKNRKLHYFLVGIVFALAFLTRNIVILWLPWVLFLLMILEKATLRNKILNAILPFLIGFTVLTLPWFIRNCLVLDDFKPLGTQGGYNLGIDYSDEIFNTQGLWIGKLKPQIYPEFFGNNVHKSEQGLAQEIALSKLGWQRATDWLTSNFTRIPDLFLIKLNSYFWSGALLYQKIIVILALAGCLLLRKQRILLVPLTIIVANAFAVMLTHNVPGGRFILASYPALYFLAATFTAKCLDWKGLS